jgi:DNA polymerase
MEKESGISEYLFSARPVPGKPKTGCLDTVKTEASNCHRCALARTRTNIVFGSGNINARLMFVGEAPGRDEDLQGMPFVGEAGMLLTKIIAAMGIKREDVYICNILKCRPPQNRNPQPEEISMCIDYLYGQIDAIKPKIICGLGKFASQTLLATETPISKLRGRWHEYRGIKFMPTYHPAYLLRNPQDKKLVWEDMKKIIHEIR